MKRKRKRRILYCELKIAADYAKNRARTLVVSWAWIREEMVRNSYVKLNGKWDRVGEDMMLYFSESGHTVLRGSSALE